MGDDAVHTEQEGVARVVKGGASANTKVGLAVHTCNPAFLRLMGDHKFKAGLGCVWQILSQSNLEQKCPRSCAGDGIEAGWSVIGRHFPEVNRTDCETSCALPGAGAGGPAGLAP